MMTMILGGIATPDDAETAAGLLIQKSLDTHAERYFAFVEAWIAQLASTARRGS